MSKFSKVGIVCISICALALTIVEAEFKHRGTLPSSTADLRTFAWQLTGIDFRYPVNWTMLSWASSSKMASHLELISPTEGLKLPAYFCVNLFANPASSTYYQLRGGGPISKAGNGLIIYQRFLDTARSEELQAWLTNDDLSSVLPLSNGTILFAEASYRCLAGDAEEPTLNAQQQQSSTDYLESLDILESVASGAHSVGT